MARRLAVLVLVLGVLLPATPAQAAPACRFQLGFAVLQQRLPAQVGRCLDDASYDAAGDAVQHTTGGLLAWRKVDNWTAFTDGYHTWVDGPLGLQERLNSQRFGWEANPEGLPITGQATTLPATALPAGSPAATGIRTLPAAGVSDAGLTALPDPALIDVGGAAVLAWVRNDATTPLNGQIAATLTGNTGSVVGMAKDILTNLLPGQRKLVELTSVAKASDVTGLRFQFSVIAPGQATPTLLTLGAPQVDPADAHAILVTVTNADSTVHSGFVSIAITNRAGAIEGIAFGPYDHLYPGLTKTVRCINLLGPVPSRAELTAQVDTAL